jgi:hypothetical protein
VERPVVTTVAGNTIKSTGSMTDTVVAVHPTTRSVVYAIRSRTHVSTSQTNPPPGFPAIGPTNQDFLLHYQVLSNGTLLAPEQSVRASGIDYRFTGFVVYPSVATLRAGGNRSTTVQVSVSSTNPAYARQLAAASDDHSSTLRYTATFRVVGLPAKKIVTPAGTFTDDVGVEVSAEGVTPLNVSPDGVSRSQLEKAVRAFTPTTTVYWARGVGMIESFTHSIFGTDVQTFNGCSPHESTAG